MKDIYTHSYGFSLYRDNYTITLHYDEKIDNWWITIQSPTLSTITQHFMDKDIDGWESDENKITIHLPKIPNLSTPYIGGYIPTQYDEMILRLDNILFDFFNKEITHD